MASWYRNKLDPPRGASPLHKDNKHFQELREKGRDLTQSYDKSPYIVRKSQKQHDNTKTPPKTSITQRLRTELGRLVGVKIATQLVWLKRLN